MRNSILFVTAIVLAACSGDLPHESPFDPLSPLATQAPGDVGGRIVLEHETDHGQVTVQLDGEVFDYDTQTDPAGRFAFARVVPGTYQLRAFSRYFDAVTRDVVVTLGSAVDVGTLSLSAVRARVTGAARAEFLSGKLPVVEGGVSLLLTRARSLRSAAAAPAAFAPQAASALTVSFTTISAPDGAWQIDDVPAGVYALTASRTGMPSQSVDEIVVDESGGVRVADLLLRPLTGFVDVVGSDGSPLYTRTPTVSLKLFGFNAQRMRLGTLAGADCSYTRDEIYSVTASYALPAVEGAHTICVRFVGEDGSETPDLFGTIVFDQTPPTLLQARIFTQNGFVTSAAAVLELAGADAGSGMAWVQWSDSLAAVTAAAKAAWSTSLLVSLPSPGAPGLKTLYLRVGDAAGNFTSIVPLEATLDLSSPTLDAVDARDLAGQPLTLTNQTRIMLELAAADADGSPLEMAISNRGDFLGAPWQPFTPNVFWDVAPAQLATGEPRTVWVRVRDAAGRAGPTASATFTLDTVAPSAPYATFAAALTNGATARLTLGGNDWTYKEIDDSFAFDSPVTTTAPEFDLALGAGDGTRTYYVRLADDAGNRSAAVAASINVDRTAPANAAVSIVQTSPTNAVNLTFNLAAEGATEYRLAEGAACGGGWLTYTSQVVVPVSVGEGVKNFHAQFRDAAGNLTACLPVAIEIDRAQPVVSAAPTVNGGQAQTRSPVVTLAATVTGAVDVQLSEDGGFAGAAWQPAAASHTWLLSPGDGLKTVYLRWRDDAGNLTAAHTATITLDATAPDGVALAAAGAAVVTSSTVALTVAANGGPAFMQLANDPSFSGAVETPYATAATWTLTGGDGLKTVYVRVRDQAGNWSLPSGVTLTLDTAAPVPLSFTLNGGAGLTNALSATATLSAAGADEVQLSGDIAGGATTWLPAQASVALTLAGGDGVKVLTARWRDAAGNYAAPVTAWITLDATPPGTGAVVVAGPDPTASPVVTLNITAAGATQMMIGNDSGFTGGQWEPVAATRSWSLPAIDGAKTVFVKFKDGAGNESLVPAQDGVVLDTTPPTGASFTVAGGSVVAGTTLTLNLFAAGAAEVMTGNDPTFIGGVWRTYAASITHEITTGDGLKPVYVKYRDPAGNETGVLSQVVTLDTGAPAGTQLLINGGALYATSALVTLNLSAADAAEMAFSNDGFAFSAWEPFAPSLGYPLPGTDGTKLVYVKFRDAALNESAVASAGIILDRAAPTAGSVAVAANAAYTRAAQVLVEIAAAGASEMQVSENNAFAGAAWEPYATLRLWTLSAGDGPKTVYVRFRDEAGHVTSFVSDSVTLDQSAPVLVSPAVRINAGAAYANSATVTINLQYVDAVSAVVAQDIGLLFPAATANLPGGGAHALAVNLTGGEGTRTVYVRFYDAAGNTSVQSASIVLDTTPPGLVTVRIDDGAPYNKSVGGAATLTISGIDNLSGITQMRASNTNVNGNLDGAAPIAYQSPFGWTLAAPGGGIEGGRTVYVKLIDQAGNASVTATDTINYDTLAPQVNAASVSIDGGATYARSTNVSLALAATGTPTEMIVGNDNSFTGRSYEPFAVSRAWTLAAGGDNVSQTVYAKFRDAAGNESSLASDSIFVDTVAPSSPLLTLDGGLEYALAEPAYTQDDEVEATLSAAGWTQADVSEDVSFFSVPRVVNAGDAMPVAVTFTAANAGDGLKTLYVRYRDAAGNASAVVSASIFKDGTPPSFGRVVLNDGAAYASSTALTATLTSEDAGSGLAQVALAQDAAFTTNLQTLSFAPSVNYVLSTAANGARTVYARFVDNAGNTSLVVSDGITLDTVDPIISAVELNAGALLTANNILSVAITATEANPAEMMLSENAAFSGATWQPYQSPTSFAASVINGAKTVYVKLRDRAGRETAVPGSDDITLDTTPPSGTSISFAYAVTKGAANVLTLVASDNLSAFGNMRVKLSGTSLSQVDGSSANVNAFIPLTATKTLSFTGTGTKTVTAVFADEAGNLTQNVVTTLTIDTTGPSGSVTLLSAQGGNKQAVLSWSASNGAAYYIVEYMPGYLSGAFTAAGSQTFTTASGTVTGLQNGVSYGFRVRSYDAVSNPDGGYSNILIAGVGTAARPVNQQGQTNRIRAMAVDGNSIYILGSDNDAALELFRSDDNGRTWTRTVLSSVVVYDNQSATLKVVNGNVIIATQAYSGSGGLTMYVSRNGGASFARYSLATFDGFSYNYTSDIGLAVEGESVVVSGYDWNSPNFLLKTQYHYAGAATGSYGWSTPIQHFSTTSNTLLNHALCRSGDHVLLVHQSATALAGRYSHNGAYSWSNRTISPYMTQQPADLECVMNSEGTAFVIHTESSLGGAGIVMHVGKVHDGAFARFTLPQQKPDGSYANWKTPQIWTNDYRDVFVSAYDDSSDTLWLMRASNSYTQWSMVRVDATVTAGLHHAMAGSGYEDVRIAYDINDRETIQLYTPALPAPGRYDVKLGGTTATISPSWSAPAGIEDFSVFSGWSILPNAAETRWSGESLSMAATYFYSAVASRDGNGNGNLSFPYRASPGSFIDYMDYAYAQNDAEAYVDDWSGYSYSVMDEFNSVLLLSVADDNTHNGSYTLVGSLANNIRGVDVAAWNNEVYVVYCNSSNGTYLKKSTDYGSTFGGAIALIDAYGWAAYANACAIDVARSGSSTIVRIAVGTDTMGDDEIHVVRSNDGAATFLTPQIIDAPGSPGLGTVDIAIDPADYTDAAIGAGWIDIGDYTALYTTTNDWGAVSTPGTPSGQELKVDVSDGNVYALLASTWEGAFFAQGPLAATQLAGGRIDVNGVKALSVGLGQGVFHVAYAANDTTLRYASCAHNCTQSAGWVRSTVMQDPYAEPVFAAAYAPDWGQTVVAPYTQGGHYMRSYMTTRPVFSSPLLTTGGLQGSYYSGTAFATKYGMRIDTSLNQSWATTVFPSPSLSDNFSVAWGGWFYVSTADNYRFYVTVDGGVRLSLAGSLLLDQWTPAAASYTSSWSSVLQPGWYPISVLFNDSTGTASINVQWQRWNGGVVTPAAAIPTNSLAY